MRVAEIMQAPVRTVEPTDSAALAWERMRQYRIHHLVVVDDGGVVGVVSAGDLGGAHGNPVRDGHPVGELMAARPASVTPQTTIREAANLLRGNGIDCLPVLDKGRLKGIVTAVDFLDLIGRGADRPTSTPERYVLKNRGDKPRQQTAAKRAAGAKRSPSRM
jgi:acetoin utilization protein AcuB